MSDGNLDKPFSQEFAVCSVQFNMVWCLKATMVSVNQQHCKEVYQFIYGPIVSVIKFPKTRM